MAGRAISRGRCVKSIKFPSRSRRLLTTQMILLPFPEYRHPLSASVTNRFLFAVGRICPILIEANSGRDLHREDALASRVESRSAHANYPISYLSAFSYSWFARGESAVPMEWVWCETKITV